MDRQNDIGDTIIENSRVFEDNFNVLSQIINNYPVTNYTESNSEIDSLNIITTQPREKKQLDDSFKYYLLITFSFAYFLYGMQNSLFGPSMLDLTEILKTETKNISFAFSVRCLTYSVSTILVSFSFKIFGNRQLQYGIALFVSGLIICLTPFMTSFVQYLIGALCAGFSGAFIDSVTNLVVLEMFSLNSKVFMQIAHSSFTFGSVFGPLFVAPYLSKSNSTVPSNSTNHSDFRTIIENVTSLPSFNGTSSIQSFAINDLEFSLSNNGTDSNNNSKSRIFIPYTIISSLMMIFAIFMIISQIVYPYIPEKRKLFAKQKSKIVEPLEEQIQGSQAISSSLEISQETNTNTNNITSSSNKNFKTETICQQINLPKAYTHTFLGLTGFLLSVYSCADGLTGMFLPSYLTKGELKIEKGEAASMASVVFIAQATGRLLTIIIALLENGIIKSLPRLKTTCKILLFFNLFMIFFGYVMLTFFAIHSKFITWVSMVVIGSGLSSTYPLILSFIENRIVITNSVQLYLLFISYFFLVFLSNFVGNFLDKTPMIFTYVNFTLSVASLILMIFIHTTDIWKRKLIRKIKEDQQNIVDNMEQEN